MNKYLGHACIGALAFTAILRSDAADYPTTVSTFNPAGYYRLSEAVAVNSNIASNSGTAGAIGNGYYVGDPGTSGTAMHPTNGVLLNGTGNTAAYFNPGYMQVPMDPSINPQGAFTAEAWVQPAVAAASLNCLMTYGHLQNPASAPNRSGWLLYCDNGSAGAGGFNFRMYNHDGINRSLTLIGGPIMNAGDWHYVAVSYDGTNGYLYVDGQLAQSGASPGFAANVDGNFSVGTRNDLAFPFEGGIIDEVALYTNALSASVILSHYNNGTNAAPGTPYNQLINASHPLLYYRFDEPAYTPSVTFPTTANTGSWGPNQNGLIGDNVITGRAGVPYTGFGGGNNAMWFNGLDAVVTTMTNTPLTLNTTVATLTAWVRPEGPTDGDGQGIGASGFAGIIYQRDTATAGTATGMSFGGNNNELRANWNDNPTVYNFNPGLAFPDRTWSMAALVFTPSNVVYFLNGNAVTQTVANASHDFSPTPIYLGWDNASSSRYMQGTLDEVAIFPSALTTAQLQSLYNAGTPPPVITVQPVGPAGSIYEGPSVSFSGAAIGALPLTYRWTKGGSFINGQTTTTLSFPSVHASDTGLYALVASNQFGSATSSIVSMTVVAGPPILTKVPTPANIYPNGNATFTTAAVGSAPITFQWMFSSGGTTSMIAGATSTSLTVNPVVAASAGNYFVVATNPNGHTNSPNAALTVIPVSPNYVGAVLTRSPVAYWRLNETSGSTAFDSQGGHNGTYNPVTTHNSAVGPRPSAFNGLESGNDAYTFDGNTSDLIAPPLNMNSFGTIICFINPVATLPNDAFGIVFERGAGADVSGLNYFSTSGGHLGYTWNADANSYNWDSGLIPTPGTWNFVAVSVGPTNTMMYLDTGTGGLQITNNAINAGPGLWAANVHLGTDPLGNRIYGGGLDEVAIFNSTLSQADIQAIHDAAFSGTFTPSPPSVLVPPASNTNLLVGDNITLTAVPAGTPPLTYQWLKNGAPVAGATHTALPLPNVALGDSGNYQFKVSNGTISVTSTPPAIITVHSPALYANLTNALLVHLRFDGTYTDSTPNGHDATPTGTPPAFIPGILGQGIHINTTPGNGYLQLVDNGGDLQNAFSDATNFSFSLWFRYTDRFNDVPIMGNAVNSTYQQGWTITDEGGKFEVSLVSTANSGSYVQDPIPTSPIVGDGNWHNAVVVVDHGGGLASCYIDGGTPFSWDISALGTLNYNNLVTIGQDPTGNYGTAVFDLDDVGFWNTVLAPLDARSIYYAGVAGRTFDNVAPSLTINVSGGVLTLHWPNGTLQGSGQPNSGYTNVTGASAPTYTKPLPAAGSAYYRVVVP